MSRIRRYLVPGLLLMPVLFICGRLLFAAVQDEAHYVGSGVPPAPQMGWPYVYCEKDWFVPWYSTTNWWLFAADVAVILLGGILLWLVLLNFRRRWTFPPRFSLRTLLLSTLSIGLIFAWLANNYHEWKFEQDLLRDHENVPVMGSDYFGPEWLRRLVSKGYLQIFWRVSWVRGAVGDDELKIIGKFTKLHLLEIENSNTGGGFGSSADAEYHEHIVTDAGLAHLANCTELSGLSIEQTDMRGIGDAGAVSLGKLNGLISLILVGTSITDKGIAQLKGLQNLEYLSLANSMIANRAVGEIAQIKSLEALNLTNCPRINDMGYRELLKLPKLENLEIGDPRKRPRMSKATYEALQKQITLQVRINGWDEKYFTDDALQPRRLKPKRSRLIEPSGRLPARQISAHPIEPTTDDEAQR